MGYGGALIYSGLVRNVKREHPDKKLVLIYPNSLKYLLRGQMHPDAVVYEQNPDIDLLTDQHRWLLQRWRYPKERIVIDLRDQRYLYHESDSPQKMVHKRGRHAIQIACDAAGVRKCELKPRIRLTKAERERADMLLREYDLTEGEYICIEPHSKDSFTPNRAWFFERWQELAQHLGQEMKLPIVQVGVAGRGDIPGTISLCGKTTFRETARILERAALFVSTEGGLAHLAAAVDVPAVILMHAHSPFEMTAYPQHRHLKAKTPCCEGLKVPCPNRRACMKAITVAMVLEACFDEMYGATKKDN